MVAVPEAIPVTTPDALTVATLVAPELQTPPVTVFAKAIGEPAHTAELPVIVPASGAVLIVMVLVAVADPQLPDTVYDMVVAPEETPVTIPAELIVAMPVAPQPQVPPLTVFARAIVEPGHTAELPVIVPASGEALIVMFLVAVAVPQPPDTVYDMIVAPEETPVTTPVGLTVATPGMAELHTPPVTVFAKGIVEPGHVAAPPVIVPALGATFTVITFVAVALPQLVVTSYDIAVVPAVIPVTIPAVLTDATPEADELHVPPLAVLLNAIVEPAQTTELPVIVPATGVVLIVTATVPVAAHPTPFVSVTL
jgi:hypothetical protein